ncbi:MAG TPA: RNA polymerase sigma factor [Armatimonadota bacterium]|nr:RNA polymerase sigma factor [Armatimonadota bacterium]
MSDGKRATRAPADEAALIARVQQGDTAALDELYRRHGDYVYTLCLNLCGNPDDAQDLLQETFVRAWRGLPKFVGRSSFSTWLYRITVNVTREARRRRRPEPVAAAVEPITAPEPGEVEQVRAVLARLKPAHRLVLVLRYSMCLSHQEIADCLRWSLSRAKVTVHRAKRAFKDEYVRAAQEDRTQP